MFAKSAIVISIVACLFSTLVNMLAGGWGQLRALLLSFVVVVFSFLISTLLLYISRKRHEKKTMYEMLVIVLPAIPLLVISYRSGMVDWILAGGSALFSVIMYIFLYVFTVAVFYYVGRYNQKPFFLISTIYKRNQLKRSIVASAIIAILFPFLSISSFIIEGGASAKWLDVMSFSAFWTFYFRSLVWYFSACFLSILLFINIFNRE